MGDLTFTAPVGCVRTVFVEIQRKGRVIDMGAKKDELERRQIEKAIRKNSKLEEDINAKKDELLRLETEIKVEEKQYKDLRQKWRGKYRMCDFGWHNVALVFDPALRRETLMIIDAGNLKPKWR